MKLKSLAVLFLFVAFFGVSTHSAKALTFDELVAQVASLKKELQTLKASMKASVTSALTSSDASTLSLGSKGVLVEKLQKALKNKGFFNDKVTGYYGSVTMNSVKKFQASLGLKSTGVADSGTQKSLYGDSYSSSNKEGEKIGDDFCLNRVVASINPTTKYLGFTLGLNNTDEFLYVMPGEKPALFPFSGLEDDFYGDTSIYPHAPYVSGSATSRLRFNETFYYLENYPDGAFDLVANPATGIDISLGRIYKISADGTKFSPVKVGFFTGEIPNCSGPVRVFDGTVNFGTCTDGIQNGDETGIDVGGRCGNPAAVQNTTFGHWARGENPVVLGIVNNADPVYTTAYNKSKISWDVSPVVNFTDGNQIRVVSGAYNQGFLSATSVQTQSVLHSDGTYKTHIIDAEIMLNNSYLTGGGLYDSDAWRLFAMCRGLGHALGLNNIDLNKFNTNLGTCMDYTADPAGLGAQGPLNNMYPSAALDFPAIQAAHHVNPGDGSNKPGESVETKTTVYTLSVQ